MTQLNSSISSNRDDHACSPASLHVTAAADSQKQNATSIRSRPFRSMLNTRVVSAMFTICMVQ